MKIRNKYLDIQTYKALATIRIMLSEELSLFDFNISLGWQDRIGLVLRINYPHNIRIDFNFLFIDIRISIGLRVMSLLHDIDFRRRNTFGLCWIFSKYMGIGYVRAIFLTKCIHAS